MSNLLETASTVPTALAELEAAWKRTDDLFAMIPPGSWSVRPIEQRHPIVFYVGHLPAFSWNLVGRAVLSRGWLRREFDSLFDFGIDPEFGEVVAEPVWPPVSEILDYRDRLRDEIRNCGKDLLAVAGERPLAEHARVLRLVLEHELMHHETLLYMFRELDAEHKLAPPNWPQARTGTAPRDARFVALPAGTVRLGAAFEELSFGWDNEFPARRVSVDAFELADLPVTVEAYRAFVEAGAYERPELWDPRASEWLHTTRPQHPSGWRQRGGSWFVRGVFGWQILEAVSGWPVEVTWAEADAFARWSGARLPSEAELHHAAYGTLDGRDDRAFPWGDEAPDARRANFGFAESGPTPVGSYPAGASARGIHDLIGGGQEWTSTAFLAHEGFENYIEGYPGYSKDFFDGQHYVVFGGSWATDTRLLRRSFRNWFRLDYPYPFTQFRLARDV